MTRIMILGGIALFALNAAANEPIPFASIDADASGTLSESEFVSWKTAQGGASPAEALVRFLEIDADANGAISPAEWKAAQAASKAAPVHSQPDPESMPQ